MRWDQKKRKEVPMNNKIVVHIPDEKLLELVEIPEGFTKGITHKENRIIYGRSLKGKDQAFVIIECKIRIDKNEEEVKYE